MLGTLFINVSMIFVNSDGVTVGGSHDDEEEVYVEPKETANVDIRSGWGLSAAGFGENLDKIKAFVDVQLFRREFHNLGEFDIPQNHEEATFIKKGIDIAGLVKIIGVTCTRKKADDDGDVSVSLAIGIRNISDIYFERITAKFSIFDQEGAEVDRAESYNYLAPRAGHVLQPDVYGLKSGRLKNCKGKLTIHVHQPVGFHSSETVLVKED